MAREKRTKKETFKKREAKGNAATESARATPDAKQKKKKKEPEQEDLAPMRYKLARPKPSDFEPPREPVFTSHHEVTDSEGRTIEFFQTSDQ
jgi:COMPASS component BRE2